ncbi:hypothetical protein AURDEDRAFT_183952, partial [Auricularia subglabra TFB-10046 SS5]
MGFCRRCGDIVHGARCKCGGLPVAAAVQLGNDKKERSPDRWTQMYTSKEPAQPALSNSPTTSSSSQPLSSALKKLNRAFPRPTPRLNAAVNAHIAASTAPRPTSPLKQSFADDAENLPADGILRAPDSSAALSKVYGSVLQPRETLKLHSCAHCATPFLPDETIFPDPTAAASARSFVCKSCYTTNGGSKGDCASCGRVVLGLANEGGFIESAGRVWHRRCFRCSSCHKDVSAKPMVDLLGRPSCPECFEHCLKPKTPTTPTKTPTKAPGNPGGMKAPGARSREGSPAIDELQAKFGIKSTPPRERELSPQPDSATKRERSSARFTSPLMMHRSRSTPSLDTTPTKPAPTSKNTTPSKSPGLFSWSRKTPEPGSSPTRFGTSPSRGSPIRNAPTPPDEDAKCTSCRRALFSLAGGGRIVRVDGDAFHASCFTCERCRRPFEEDGRGQAVFVRASDGRGRVHVECAMPPPPAKATTTFQQHKARAQSVDVSKTSSLGVSFRSPSSVDLTAGLRSPPAFGRQTCPGCGVGVAPMERGVVQGPSGSKWHATCLVCGGKGARKTDGKPGCGKKLDSGARCDDGGTAFCRECWMLLPRSPQASPLSPNFTGMSASGIWSSRAAAASTGALSLSRQLTGNANASTVGLGLLSRQNTGGGGSLSRPGSPVKQLGITHSLKHKPSASLGRGMRLVRQLTGQSQG